MSTIQHDPAGPPGFSTPFICIYASQVAMCIGANRHRKVSEAVELMWQRCDPAGFRAALRRNGTRTEEEVTREIIDSHEGVRELVDHTASAPCRSSQEVARSYDAAARELREVPLPEGERRLVDDVLKRNLYTGYGNREETSVLDYLRARLGIACQPDAAFYKRQAGVAEGPWGRLPWFVGGKIDAIDPQRTLLIEIKNRVNRLFYRVPFYEQVQVQTYLHLLDLERGVLAECLKSAAAPVVNVVPVHRDRAMWEQDIVPKLQGFVEYLALLLHDPGEQDRYMQSRRRSALVTRATSRSGPPKEIGPSGHA